MARALSLAVRNLVFTIVVPGLGGAWLPWRILTRDGPAAASAWEAVPVIAAGAVLYAWCVWNFAAVGRGTPGPWDAPSRMVATGPYRWVRNPIYLAALLAYAGAMAVCFHLFVVGYEERALTRRFGRGYADYQGTVARWIPRAPRSSQKTTN